MEANKKKIVLYVEDDPDDWDLLYQTAATVDPSVEVVHAPNGEVALRTLQTMIDEGRKPCLVILDMNMPIMDGRETFSKIRDNEEWKAIPVAIYSTSPRHLYKDLEQQDNTVVVTKPASYNDIVVAIRHLLSFCKV